MPMFHYVSGVYCYVYFDQMHVNLIWYLYPFMLNKICLSLSLSHIDISRFQQPWRKHQYPWKTDQDPGIVACRWICMQVDDTLGLDMS